MITLPNSPEAEQFIVGCAILDATNCADKINLEWFYDLRNRNLIDLVNESVMAGKPVDATSIGQRLVELKLWEKLGLYMLGITDLVHSTAAFAYYAGIAKDKYLLRQIYHVGTRFAERALMIDANPSELLDEFEQEVMAIRKPESVDATMHDNVIRSRDDLEETFNNQGKVVGIETGLCDLDKNTNGLQGGQLVVLAARPGLGKSSLAMNIAEHVAISTSRAVTVFSLEMTSLELTTRMLCSRANVDTSKARAGILTQGDFKNLARVQIEVARSKINIVDDGELTMPQIRAIARRHKLKYGTSLVVIDYLQLVHTTGRTENRSIEVGRISKSMKAMAKELNIPVIALAQLNRDSEREDRPPFLSDLRESGSIESDGDMVWLLHLTDKMYVGDILPVDLIIAKHRGGRCGRVHLHFKSSLTRFLSATKEPSSQNLPYNDI